MNKITAVSQATGRGELFAAVFILYGAYECVDNSGIRIRSDSLG